MVDLGYVHEGFYNAVAPFLDTLLPAVNSYVQAIQVYRNLSCYKMRHDMTR